MTEKNQTEFQDTSLQKALRHSLVLENRVSRLEIDLYKLKVVAECVIKSTSLLSSRSSCLRTHYGTGKCNFEHRGRTAQKLLSMEVSASHCSIFFELSDQMNFLRIVFLRAVSMRLKFTISYRNWNKARIKKNAFQMLLETGEIS